MISMELQSRREPETRSQMQIRKGKLRFSDLMYVQPIDRRTVTIEMARAHLSLVVLIIWGTISFISIMAISITPEQYK